MPWLPFHMSPGTFSDHFAGATCLHSAQENYFGLAAHLWRQRVARQIDENDGDHLCGLSRTERFKTLVEPILGLTGSISCEVSHSY